MYLGKTTFYEDPSTYSLHTLIVALEQGVGMGAKTKNTTAHPPSYTQKLEDNAVLVLNYALVTFNEAT